MLDRIKGEIVFTCDNCEDYLETSEDDFAQANQVRKDSGWFAWHTSDGWAHHCSRCGAFEDA